jgi:alanine racemase
MTSDHPTAAFVDLDRLLHNLAEIGRRLKGRSEILAVVKADAYGHGMVPVARCLETAGIRKFGVAYVEEGVRLRRSGIRGSILVMGGWMPGQVSDLIRHALTPVLFHPDHLTWLSAAGNAPAEPLPVHIKVDTGMGRLGLAPGEVTAFAKKVRDLKGFRLEGLMSHFSDDDLSGSALARDQVGRFARVRDDLAREGIAVPVLHMANSAAILSLESAWWQMVRPGISLYGYAPARSLAGVLSLEPVMTLKSRIAHLRKVPPGTPVGYGQTFVTRRESRLAVIPIGYGDGYLRVLSNRGEALVGGRRAPIVGRVSMDLVILDVTDISGCRMTDEVVLLGRQGNETISAVDLAERAGTIPYEILSGLGPRIPRVYSGGPADSGLETGRTAE